MLGMGNPPRVQSRGDRLADVHRSRISTSFDLAIFSDYCGRAPCRTSGHSSGYRLFGPNDDHPVTSPDRPDDPGPRP
jgi:hypothetical protein